MPPSHHPEINKYHIIDPVSITLLLVCCLFDTWLWVLLRLKDLISRVFLRVSELVIGISPAEVRENVCNPLPLLCRANIPTVYGFLLILLFVLFVNCDSSHNSLISIYVYMCIASLI